jgi:hypothetical protein
MPTYYVTAATSTSASAYDYFTATTNSTCSASWINSGTTGSW